MSSLDRVARAADATSISLTGTHLTLVVVVAAIAVVALVMGVTFRRQVLAADPGHRRHAGDRQRRRGGRPGLPGAPVQDPVGLRRHRLLAAPRAAGGHRRRALGALGLLRAGRGLLRGHRLPRHEPRGEGQRPRRLGRPWRQPRGRHADRLPDRRHRRHGDRRPRVCWAPPWSSCSTGARRPRSSRASASARPCWRCSCGSAAASSPRPPTSAPTSSARWRRASPRTTPATRPRSPTTSATTSATAPAWPPTCSSPTR